LTPPRASASRVSSIPEEPLKVKIANQTWPPQFGVHAACLHRQQLFHQLELGCVVGREGDLDRDAVDIDRLRHVA
jgi:hypothetical protein